MRGKIRIKLLIVPHFEFSSESSLPGEGRLFCEEFVKDGETFIVAGGREVTVNVETGVALYVSGIGKVNNAIAITTILADSRFDFTDAYILTLGCAGGARGYCTMGDVCIVTSTVDFDLGHAADIREMSDPNTDKLWFPDKCFDETCFKRLNASLADGLFDAVKDIKLDTTENTKKLMAKSFPGEDWALREPKVVLGTSVSGDNYWKGFYGHQRALQQVEYYGCRDPYAVSEMEDVAVAAAAERFGLLDRMIAIHAVVNMDVFLDGDSPEKLWNEADFVSTVTEENSETSDIFETAMNNNFRVGRAIIEKLTD